MRPSGTPRRAVVVGMVAITALVGLSACGQAPGPRMRSIADSDAERVIPAPPVNADATPAPDAAPSTCPQGPYQLEVEQALAATGNYGTLTVDGQQSASDCAIITTFQQRMGIVPADGTAGELTRNVAQRIAATDTANCPYSDAPIACVDLTDQTFYIMQGGLVILGPTVTRTGKPGYATPAGDFKIADRALQEWSIPFSVWLPYWQNFYYGDGLHQTTTYIHDMPVGSHGCVNLLHDDAAFAYSVLRSGDTVHLYGHRPGT